MGTSSDAHTYKFTALLPSIGANNMDTAWIMDVLMQQLSPFDLEGPSNTKHTNVKSSQPLVPLRSPPLTIMVKVKLLLFKRRCG
eukprot:6277539-Amphidinium_carterae.1